MLDVDFGKTEWYQRPSTYIKAFWYLISTVYLGFLTLSYFRVHDVYFPFAVSSGPSYLIVIIGVTMLHSSACMLCFNFNWLTNLHLRLFVTSCITCVVSGVFSLIFYIAYSDKKNLDTGISSFNAFLYAYPTSERTIWIKHVLGLDDMTENQQNRAVMNYIAERTTNMATAIGIFGLCWFLYQIVNMMLVYNAVTMTSKKPGQPSEHLAPSYN